MTAYNFDTEAMAIALAESAAVSVGLPPTPWAALDESTRAIWISSAGSLIQRWITRAEELGRSAVTGCK